MSVYGEKIETIETPFGNIIEIYNRPTPYEYNLDQEWYFVTEEGVILRALSQKTVDAAKEAIEKISFKASDASDEMDALHYMKETI